MRKRGTAAALVAVFAATTGFASPARAAEPADLNLNVAGETRVAAGRTHDFWLTVRPTIAPDDPRTIRAVLTLPAGASFEGVRPDASGPCTAAGATVTCAAETLNETQQAYVWHLDVRLATDIPLQKRLRFTAVTSSGNTEATPADNTASWETTVVHLADLGITAIPPTGKVVFGQPVKYTLVIRNHGPRAVRHFALRESFDAWYGGGTVTGAGEGECFADPGMMTCDVIRDLPPGAEVRLDHVLPTQVSDTADPLRQKIRARIYDYEGDENPANDEVIVAVHFAKKGAGASPAPGGDGGGGLPITGPSTLPITLAGLLLLLLGGAAVAAARRRGA